MKGQSSLAFYELKHINSCTVQYMCGFYVLFVIFKHFLVGGAQGYGTFFIKGMNLFDLEIDLEASSMRHLG